VLNFPFVQAQEDKTGLRKLLMLNRTIPTNIIDAFFNPKWSMSDRMAVMVGQNTGEHY
jgi:hypothetical protein